MYSLNQIQLPSSIEAQDNYFSIVGFALNGPVDVPFIIRDSVSPYEVLGVCPMADAYVVARSKGIKPLLLRLNGSHGVAEIKFPDNSIAFKVKSVEANTRCNTINITVYPTHIRVTGVTGNERFYVYSSYPTINSLVQAINDDARYGIGEITATTDYPFAECSTLTNSAYDLWLEDGHSGDGYISRFDGTDTVDKYNLQIELLRESLLDESEESYSHTGEFTPFNIDTILVPDITYENAPLIAEIMGKYAESKSNEQNSFCSVVIGSMFFKEEESEDYLYSPMIQQLIDTKAISNEEYYSHVEIVIGVEQADERNAKIPVATRFASSRYLLPIAISATNKEIADINTLFSRLRKEDIASLAASGYTCIIPSIRRGHVAYKSISFLADNNLIMSKPHYGRASRYYANQIVNSLGSFIGQPANSLQLNAMEQLLRQEIEEVKALDVYKTIDYVIEGSGTSEIKVTLTFAIYGEIESVQTSVSYDPARKMVIEWM